MEPRIYDGNELILEETGIQSWNKICVGKGILVTGISEIDYLYNVVVFNTALTMLVTGYESYCKKRFPEIEGEGIAANEVKLFESFLTNKEKESGLAKAIKDEAKQHGISSASMLVAKRCISFQSFEECKKAYRTGFGISFGDDLGLPSQSFEDIQRYLRYRHHIIHVSPTTAMFEPPRKGTDDPIFASKELVDKAENVFDEFIQALHNATLELRPTY